MCNSYMNRWFQEGTPSSYKIQLRYVDIPPEFVLPHKVVDTPFRFRTFEEAIKSGQEMFPGYEVQIVGSNDQPHWQEPEAHLEEAEMKKGNWYDVYGVSPAHKLEYAKGIDKQIMEPVPIVRELERLRPMSQRSQRSQRADRTTQTKQEKQRKQKVEPA